MAILCTTYVLVASLETAGVFLQFRQLAVWYLGDSGILVCEWQPLFFRQSWRWRGVLPNLPGAYSFAPLLRLLPVSSFGHLVALSIAAAGHCVPLQFRLLQ